MKILRVLNRQKLRSVRATRLRKFAEAVLTRLEVREYELGVHLVAAQEMARVNEQFLGHAGSTDVITFDHGSAPPVLQGEIFICLDDAVQQAKEFGTSWQSETARYFLHGVLHLLGFDDLTPAARSRMKRRENALMREFEGARMISELAHD